MMELLDESLAAQKLGLKKATLAGWRMRGCGPAHIRMGKRIAYRPEDLDLFILDCRVDSREAVRV